MLKSVEWGEFRLGDLFEILSSKKIYHANTISKIFDNQVSTSYPYVVRTTLNNGVRGYIIEDELDLNDGNTLSFAQDTFSVFYQKQKYFTGNKVKVLKAKFDNQNERIMQYLTVSFQKALSTFTWGIGSTIETITKTTISLPTKNNKIDFAFMEKFIAELEAERIAELEAYLVATGLKDYTLSDEEQRVLAEFESVEWGEFRLGDLFEIQNTLSFNKDSLTVGSEYDYVTRTSQNQGILQETGFVNQENINPSGTWSLGLLQMDFFYRERPWYAGQFVRKIIPKIKLTKSSILYLSTLLNKGKKNLLSGLVRDVDKAFTSAKIHLPTKNTQPDYQAMETLIRAVQKLVIKDVVVYANTKIATTKEVIAQ